MAAVYSDVAFMGRETVAFSLRLRQSGELKLSPSMRESFLPDLVVKGADEPEDFVKQPTLSDATSAQLLENYNGCPDDHQDCIAREEKFERIEEVRRFWALCACVYA